MNLTYQASRAQTIPLAPGLPLIGSALSLYKDPLVYFLKCYQELGPVYRVRAPGRNYVIMAGPEANAFLLQGGERHLEQRPLYQHIAAELQSDHYPISTTGERHRALRRALRPALSAGALSPHVPAMLARAAAMARSFRAGQRLNVSQIMHRLVGEQMGLTLLSRPLGPLLDQAMHFARVSVGAGLGAYPSVALRLPSYRRAKRRVMALMRDIVAAHRRDPPGAHRSPDLVDLLLGARNEKGEPLSDNDVIANAQMAYSNSLLYAAPACGFLLYALLKEPRALRRVVDEIDAAFAGGLPDAEALCQMRCLRGAMMESMRMHPIALATPRVVAEPFEFCGRRLARGEIVLVAGTVCHYLPQCFPDPHTFDIDRFSAPRNEHHQPGLFVPFGLGQRVCIGGQLVDLLAMVNLAGLLREVALGLDPPGYQLVKVVNPFPEPEAGFSVRVTAARGVVTGRLTGRASGARAGACLGQQGVAHHG